jgi:membrane-bound lytic murein transglycosylase MltF
MPLFKRFASQYLWLVLAAGAYALDPVINHS